MTEFEKIFVNTLENTGMSEFFPFADRFEMLYGMLVKTNESMNLTAITDPEGVILRHFADSLTAARLIPENASVIDVGCGGGFPCLPLAIVRSDIKITALDSTAKKLVFVKDAADKLGLSVKTLAMRAEDAAHDISLREKFDVAVSRAVARMNILGELCLPLVRVGGKFVAMKGADGENELAEAEKGLIKLGGSVKNVTVFGLSEAGKRCIVETVKEKKTPPEYPRQFAKIKKSPL